MSILAGNVVATPSRVVALHRYLRDCAPDGESEQRVLDRLQPPVLRGNDPDGAEEEDQTTDPRAPIVARAVVNVAAQLGIVERSSGTIVISAQARGADEVRLRKICLASLVMDDQRPFGLELAWFLQYSPERAITFVDDAKQRQSNDKLDRDAPPFELDISARRDNFLRWTRWLGFSWHLAIGRIAVEIPDPTAAITPYLDDIFAGSPRLPAPEFRDELSKAIPVLDGGKWSRALGKSDKNSGAKAGELSPAVSLALLRLERRRLITLDAAADAPGGSLKLCGIARTFAFVSVPKR